MLYVGWLVIEKGQRNPRCPALTHLRRDGHEGLPGQSHLVPHFSLQPSQGVGPLWDWSHLSWVEKQGEDKTLKCSCQIWRGWKRTILQTSRNKELETRKQASIWGWFRRPSEASMVFCPGGNSGHLSPGPKDALPLATTGRGWKVILYLLIDHVIPINS